MWRYATFHITIFCYQKNISRKKVNHYHVSTDNNQIARLTHAFEHLELDGMKSSFEKLAEEAVTNHTTPFDFLEQLLEKEIMLKEDTRTLRWITQARFPWQKTLKEFDFAFQPSIDQTLIFDLASSRFIEQGRNVILVGPPGVGKTHLSVALGIEAIQHGYDTRFLLLNDLIDHILKCNGDVVRLQRLLTTLLRPRLLILDDIDYYTMTEETAEFMFKLVMQRYNSQTSTIFTSNKNFDDWVGLFGQKQRASAAVDRITERAEIIVVDGTSYRLKEKAEKAEEAEKAEKEGGVEMTEAGMIVN